jgi:hypothetical protein
LRQNKPIVFDDEELIRLLVLGVVLVGILPFACDGYTQGNGLLAFLNIAAEFLPAVEA